MPIIHRYENELTALETDRVFCGELLQGNYNLLIIGTFNPNDESCVKTNNATWFYGRKQSKFWRYLPQALGQGSLHESDGNFDLPTVWRNYCVENRIVIIDLVKRIETDNILDDFGDDKVNTPIQADLGNVSPFNISAAFQGVSFNRVVYSLLWSDPRIDRLIHIRNNTNQALLETRCIANLSQIKYAKTPSRNDTFDSWNNAINF